jgi:uncharacterized protein (DUF488 family)
MPERSILTIGHSNRTLEELLDLLETHRVDLVTDVRTIPRSRKNPQFNRETLPAALEARGIGYLHLPRLGGLRRPRLDSPNAGFRNLSFRGYADHMSTPDFETGLEEFLRAAEGKRAALLCAEAVPWRCHRSLIADALVARGRSVEHILGRSAPRAHAFTSFGRIEAGRIVYREE